MAAGLIAEEQQQAQTAAHGAPSAQTEAAPLSKDDFKQQVVSGLTIFLGTSKALHEKGDDLDPARRRELTAMLVRKAEELQSLLAPIVRRL